MSIMRAFFVPTPTRIISEWLNEENVLNLDSCPKKRTKKCAVGEGREAFDLLTSSRSLSHESLFTGNAGLQTGVGERRRSEDRRSAMIRVAPIAKTGLRHPSPPVGNGKDFSA
jgi:hypothetical protein